MYILSDIFIGDFPMTQGFGQNPAMYAGFGLQGHNGTDWGCPTGTKIVSTADGWVSEVGSDPSGYGNYVKVVHDGYLTIYAHLDHAVVQYNQKVKAGELLGISDNTGNSTGAHLHFGVAPCDANGVKTESGNGYGGYIDPNGSRCKWEIKNLTSPGTPQQINGSLPPNYSDIIDRATKYDALFKLNHNNEESIKQKDETIKNLNTQLAEQKELLKQKDLQLATQETALNEKQKTIDTLQPQADKVVQAMKERDQAILDKSGLSSENSDLRRQNTNLQNGSNNYKKLKNSVLIQELFIRFMDKITNH